MACFVSLSFSVPLCSLQNSLEVTPSSKPQTRLSLKILSLKRKMLEKVGYPKKSASGRLPGLATTKTASYFLPPCSTNKGICSVSGQHYLTTLSKHFDEIVSCSLIVSSCTRMVIMGYWVGPDIDDGWGFVEASIDWSS